MKVEIRVRGRIAADWSEWLADLTITHADEDETILSGELPDQAALYGVLGRLRDLGLALVAVRSLSLGEGA